MSNSFDVDTKYANVNEFNLDSASKMISILFCIEMSFDDFSFLILAVNKEKHDRERSEKQKDLDGQTLGKNEKELLVIDNLSYQVLNILLIRCK